MKKYIVISAVCAALLLSGMYHCPLYQTVGIPCPACGITRAYRLLLGGNIAEAFRMHPLFWLPPLFILKPLQKKWLLVSAAVIFIIVYAWRFFVLFGHTPPFEFNYNSVLGGFLR